MTSSLLKRWITALIAGPSVVVLIVWAPGIVFLSFVGVVALLASFEYAQMSFGRMTRPETVEGGLMAFIVVASCYNAGGNHLSGAITGVIIWIVIRYMIQYQIARTPERPDMAVVCQRIFGYCVLPLLLSHLALLRQTRAGAWWLLMMFLIVVAGDVAAFFVGTKFGKRKLMPAVSPAKTWEGAMASLSAGVIVACLYGHYVLPEVSWLHLLLVGAGTNLLAQLGDLGESLMKRSSGAKDSGRLLPGHGGVLDRVDAFLFAAPFVYYYKVIWIG